MFVTDGSYSVSVIQDYFEYIIKKHQIVTDNPPIRIENRITFRVKTGYLTYETVKLLESTKSKITTDGNG